MQSLHLWKKIFILHLKKSSNMDKVSSNGPGDQGSILGRVISKTQKMVLDTCLLYTQNYKVLIKGKVEQSKERSSALIYTSVE